LKGLYLIGLTGNIACGKSTVLEMLAERGAAVIDADQVTRELQAPGEPIFNQTVAAFGEQILTAPGGPIDRQKLGAIVFNDREQLRRLEQIVHPAVHARIMDWLEHVRREASDLTLVEAEQASSPGSHSSKVAVIDAIKLLEAGWKPLCDAIWVVTCPPEQQLARLMTTRGMSPDEARTRIAAQPPQAEKVAQADVVIENSATLVELERQVDAAWAAIVQS
jgi:dephospho-CoA kinase